MTVIATELLPRYVFWPKPCPYSGQEIREIFAKVRRFVDYDGTIAGPRFTPRPKLCGRPLADFLSEEPFIVQTMNPEGARIFFRERHPELPQPVLIIVTPGFAFTDRKGRPDLGKDLAALGISGVTVIDDLPPEGINAPGCTIVGP